MYDFKISTISDYFNSVKFDANYLRVEWPVAKGDFWAYNYMSKQGAYWTGYYSTGPEIKLTIRHFSDFVQSSTQLMNSFHDRQLPVEDLL